MSSFLAHGAERDAIIQAYRDFADWLEANPAVSVDRYQTPLSHHPQGTDAEERAAVDAFAAIAGVATVASGGHYSASVRFGPVEYRAVAITQQTMDDHDEVRRLGAQALAAKKAAEADVIDVEATEVLELSQADAVHGMFGGHMESHGGREVYVAPCGTADPIRQTGIFAQITCGMCTKALIS